jgi:radical SAM enzyme (TIGR01210 family)
MMTDLTEFKHSGTLHTDGPLNSAQYVLFISKVMQALHSRIPHEHRDLSEVPAPVDYREERFENENCRRAVLFLLSNGCEWAIAGANGCTMCGHLAKQTRSLAPLSADDLMSQFMGAFARIDFSRAPILNLYNNGSFFNEREIPGPARVRMLKEIHGNKSIRMLVVESRPEFITERMMEETRALVPDLHVEVAMGLEAMDDSKRMICVNKGFTVKAYDRAMQIIRRAGLHPRSYVLLKPPFFSEKEGVEEAIRTTEHAFNAGARTVSLEACTNQKYTLTEYLLESRLFHLAKLWSIVEVVKKTHRLGNLIVGLFQFFPKPENVPYNCCKCSDRVLSALKEYNRTLQVEALEGLDCECKAGWEEELRVNQETFEHRLEAFRTKVRDDKLLDSQAHEDLSQTA